MFANIINPLKSLVWSPFQWFFHPQQIQQQERAGVTPSQSTGKEEAMVQTRRNSEGGLATPETEFSQPRNDSSKRRMIREGSSSKKRRRVGDDVQELRRGETPTKRATEITPRRSDGIFEIPASQATRGGNGEEQSVKHCKKRVMVAVVVEKTITPPGEYVDFPEALEEDENVREGDDKSSRKEEKKQASTFKHSKDMPTKAGHTAKTNGRGAHVRFGDHDLQVNSSSQEQAPLSSVPTHMGTSTKHNEADSDDEAPETVHLSTAQRTVAARQREAAKAAQSQAAAVRQKRRDRDRQLKEQAQLHQSMQHDSVPETPPDPLAQNPSSNPGGSTMMDQPTSPYGYQKSRSKPELPELLPEEILAAEPYRPLPPDLLEAADHQRQRSKQHIWFTAEDKPPKDVRRGPVKVRVLEQRNPVLAPRASKASRSIREQWLAGRVKVGGGLAVERRKPDGGFVKP